MNVAIVGIGGFLNPAVGGGSRKTLIHSIFCGFAGRSEAPLDSVKCALQMLT